MQMIHEFIIKSLVISSTIFWSKIWTDQQDYAAFVNMMNTHRVRVKWQTYTSPGLIIHARFVTFVLATATICFCFILTWKNSTNDINLHAATPKHWRLSGCICSMQRKTRRWRNQDTSNNGRVQSDDVLGDVAPLLWHDGTHGRVSDSCCSWGDTGDLPHDTGTPLSGHLDPANWHRSV